MTILNGTLMQNLDYLRSLERMVESATDVLFAECDNTRVSAWDEHPADVVRTACQEEVERVTGDIEELLKPQGKKLVWDKDDLVYRILILPDGL